MLARNRQRGLTSLGWLMVMLVVMVAFISAIRVGPVYFENWTVRDIIDQVAVEAKGEGLSRSQIHQRLEKKFLINSVKGISVREVEVLRSRDEMTIDATYEVRKRLFFNLDVVVVFDDMIITVQLS